MPRVFYLVVISETNAQGEADGEYEEYSVDAPTSAQAENSSVLAFRNMHPKATRPRILSCESRQLFSLAELQGMKAK